MNHVPQCCCVKCIPLGSPETRPRVCKCVEAAKHSAEPMGLTCSPEEQMLCGWRDVEPGELGLSKDGDQFA